MLVQFSVDNFRSFRNKIVFSMVASPIKELPSHIISCDSLKLLKTGILYGANASGKTNLLKAINFMKNFVLNSTKDKDFLKSFSKDLFQLNKKNLESPSEFEVVFLIEEILYRYGFTILNDEIDKEWLYSTNTKSRKPRESLLFSRERDEITVGTKFKEGNGKTKMTRPNSLFLTLTAMLNGTVSTEIVKWFENIIIILEAREIDPLNTVHLLEKKNIDLKDVLHFLSKADFNIKAISIEPQNISTNGVPEYLKEVILENEKTDIVKGYNVKTTHQLFDSNDDLSGEKELELFYHESKGTQKFFHLIGPILQTIKNNGILFIDEIESSLHPLLTRVIIETFTNNTDRNNHSQAVFTTHDTSHLDGSLFRRDEIWFSDKDFQGGTVLFSLAQYKQPQGKVRNDEVFRKNYLNGKYGAIPIINSESLMDN